MLLNIITGGIGSGKSEYLYGLIRENLRNNPDANAVLIVPEQFSYTAEKTLSEIFGGIGPNKIEVLTFSRLMHRCVNPENTLLPSGKMMLLAKAASDISRENVFFSSSRRTGFMSALADLFSEFKRYSINPCDLDEITLQNDSAGKKLSSVNEIYKRYIEAFGEDFLNSEDIPAIFAELISSSDIFKNTFFFIDDYNDFMPQHYDVIRAMLTASRGVFVTLTLSEGNELFAPVLKTKNRLFAIARSENAQIYTKELSACPSYIEAPDIRFLLENWESQERFPGKCENISLFTSRDLYSEIEHIAAQIISLVRDKGMRFRDIGVILGDTASYLHILNAVFADFNIPFFTDEKISVAMHPIVRTVLSLFSITKENWSYSAVFDYLRSGYIYIKKENGVVPISQEDIDMLENYVLSQGIRGKKTWFSPWESIGETVFDDVIDNYSLRAFDLEKLNTLREQIILPFENFLKIRERNATAIATGVYNFLCDINLYEGILYECEKFDSAGLRDESEQFKQIWNSVTEVLNQIVVTVGGDVLSREKFCDYLTCGLSECKISIIPSGLDRVSVGSVERNSPARVKALFIAGAVYGSIPKTPSASAILTPLDRSLIGAALSEKDKELAPDDIGRLALENLKLYRVISTAMSSLFVSFPAANSDGNALSPASIVNTLSDMFPDIKKDDNILSAPSDEELLASSKRGFNYMLIKLSEYYRCTPEPVWRAVFDRYSKNDEYKDKMYLLKAAATYRKMQPSLSRKSAELLFGNRKRYSITSLEKYNRCPFSYYLENGLRIREQEIRRVEKSHIGSLVHAAIYNFSRLVEKGAESAAEIHRRWEELSDERTNELVRVVMQDIRSKVLARANDEKNQLTYLLSRCERTLRKSLETVRKSLALGGYTAVCYEKDFEVKIDWKKESITLFGTIDRIDVMEKIAENRADIRIIDYKSGHKKFSIASIVNKVDMQLVLYALAAVKMYSAGKLEKTDSKLSPRVSAIMYSKLTDETAKISKPDKALAKKELTKLQKTDGVIITDDDTDLCDMDKTLAAGEESEFLKLKLTQKGTPAMTSQLTTRENFDVLCDYMKKAVIDTDREISSGNISISPYKKAQSSPCTYCAYGDICAQNREHGSYRNLFTDDDAALEFARKELEDE